MSAGMPCSSSNACRQATAPAPPVATSVPSMSKSRIRGWSGIAHEDRVPSVGRVVALLVVVLLAAAAPGHAQAPTEVRVMTFNIWLGGDVVDSGSVIRAIQGANADIVGLQEAEGNTRKIAQALGWPYWSDRLDGLSRPPPVDPPGGRGGDGP